MGHISGGTVTYERRIKTGEFEHKHANAQNSFTIAEGENEAEMIDKAGAHAHFQVHRLVGAKDTANLLTDKDRLARKQADKPPTPAAQTDGVKVDPAGMEVAGKPADPASLDDVLTGASAPMKDEDLLKHITKVNEATKNTPAIRVLIGKYTPQDGAKHSAVEIAQDKRAAFLLELNAIPAVAA